MSVEAVDWAFRQIASRPTEGPSALGPSEKLVLVYLAKCHHHSTGQCNPKGEKIAEFCGVSLRTVRDALKGLKNCNLVESRKRRSGKRQGSSQYIFPFDPEFQGDADCTLIEGDDEHETAPRNDAGLHPV